MRHRPIGVGVQGLADVFFMMNLPFTSDKAKEINHNIFETMYHAALEKSMEMAITDGKYETFDGSPASMGILQFDMWNVKQTNNRYNWDELKQKIIDNGLRNSMLLALMPTASTSQILGNNEAFEPITSNIYSRKTNSGEFVIVNKYLINDLIKLKLWNEKIKDNIIANNGSVQHINLIPEDIREKYRTVWEIKMKDIIDMSADRGNYIDQTQSLNLFIQEPNYNNLTSMYFYGWQKGLKTGLYYLRRRSTVKAQQFTIEPELNNEVVDDEDEEKFVCDSCGA
jgi:ribonucleotide reductase alpha subunit